VTHTTAATDIEVDAGSPDVGLAVRRSVIMYVVLTGTLLSLGAVGRLVVFDSAIGDAEAEFVGWIADHRVRGLDVAATIGSSLSDTWTVIGVLSGATVVLAAAGHVRWVAVMMIGIGLELAVFFSVSEIIDRTRPDVPALHSVPATPSFPSGHVAASVVLYGTLLLAARGIARPGRVHELFWIAPAVIAVTVAASRVYEGVHFPTDVAAGLLVGIGALSGATFIVSSVPSGPRGRE
jgi:membrane-associated phospholipid phosphatase